MQLQNIFLLFLSFFSLNKSKVIKIKQTETKKEILSKINIDLLPSLDDLINELNLQHRRLNLIKMGVTETRHLLRFKNMDYQMMIIEWDGENVEDEVANLKKKAEDLLKIATIVEKPEPLENNERNKLRSGRLYLPSFVQSFEYISAAFGSTPPIGPLTIYIPDQLDGCTLPSEDILSNYKGKLLIVKRGNCTFLEKSLNALRSGASVLAIINTEDRIESVASGLGIDPKITAEMVTPLDKYPVIGLSNTSFIPLTKAYQNKNLELKGSIIPLKCVAGGHCDPVLDEEKSYQTEVTWGELTLNLNKTTLKSNYLTSTFGGYIPNDVYIIDLLTLYKLYLPSDNINNDTACSPLPPIIIKSIQNIKNSLQQQQQPQSIGLIIRRGDCRFDQKVLNIQQSLLVDLVILYDIHDFPLQRLGGVHPYDGYLSIPALMLPYYTINLIQQTFLSSIQSSVSESILSNEIDSSNLFELPLLSGKLTHSKTNYGTYHWIEISLTEWEEKPFDKLLQIEGLKNKYSREANSESNSIIIDDIFAWLVREEQRVSTLLNQ